MCSYTDQAFYEKCKQEYLQERGRFEETGEAQETRRTSS